MKRLLTLLALAGLSAAAVACGDDSGDDDKVTPTPDAGNKDAATGKPDARAVQIDNLAAKCTANGDCKGTGSVECLKELDLAGNTTELPGGYCTAQCNYASECGPTGGCPVAEIIDSAGAILNAIPGGADLIRGFLPQNCIEVCTGAADAGTPVRGTCSQSDHLCQSLTAAGGGGGGGGAAGGFDISTILGNSPALKKSYCFPEIDLGDAGIPVRNDAGARAITVTGLDAGI